MKGKSRRKRGNFKEKSQDKSQEKPPDCYKERNPGQKCQRCLGKLHPKKTCPASFSKCNKCSKIGHWAQACKSSKPGKVFEVAEEEKSSFLGEIVDVCEVQSNPTKSPWIETVLVDKKPVNFKLDSGADVTVTDTA